jgi:hypothetical protein
MTQTHKTRRAGGAAGLGDFVCLAANSPQNSRIERPPQAQSRLRGIDFEAVNRAALAVLPAVLARIVPGGKVQGHEYEALNPTRGDRRPGSFKINLRSGKWADFATGDRGGDPVSLGRLFGRRLPG